MGDTFAAASIRGVILGLLLAASSPVALAQQAAPLSYLQGLAPRAAEAVTAHGPEMLGDRVNLYNGALEFEHTDTRLPGNSRLSVDVVRRHVAGRSVWIKGQFGDWDLEVPRISGVFSFTHGWVGAGQSAARCSNFSTPPAVGDVLGIDYWQGTYLNVPGAGSQEILRRTVGNNTAPTDGHSYPLLTREHWQIRCLATIQNGSGEGYVAVSPDGVQYRFDWMAQRLQPPVKKGGATVARREFMLMATQVTDRFGNTVNYQYDPAHPMRLLSIQASDGRVVSLTYNSDGYVSAVSDGTRKWTYAYAANGELIHVQQPDGARWEFSLRTLVHLNTFELGEHANCESPGFFPEGTYVGTVKHPSGAVGTFAMAYVRHGRANVTKWCSFEGNPPKAVAARWPKSFVSQTLLSKKLAGPGLPAAGWTWQYGYTSNHGSWAPCSTCINTKVVTVTDPAGHITRSTFGARFHVDEGQLLKTEEGYTASGSLRVTDLRYRAPAGMPYPEPAGASINVTADPMASWHRPLDRRIITQQGVQFTWEVAAGSAGFDHFARVRSVTRASGLGHTRTDATVYADNHARWVLGQIASVTASVGTGAGLVEQSFTYHATTALPIEKRAFGRLVETYDYHSDGNLHKRYDPAARATTFANYHRGIARTVTLRDGKQETASVNNLGLITSYTNAAGTIHVFGYDAMGRLASVGYPSESGFSYHPTYQSFQSTGAAAYGLDAGHWRQEVSTGNAVTERYYDALWRVRLERRYDAENEAGTRRVVETRHDHDGRKTFESYAQRDIAAIGGSVAGRWWTHDGLGRELLMQESSELGTLSTTTSYLAGFQRQVTNPRGHVTTYSHQVFDQPVQDAISLVGLPLNVTVALDRDLFGKARSITRSGTYGGQSQSVTRSYVYDDHQRLCKTIEPESGATVQAYDAAGNVAWRASGQNLTGTGSCDQGSVPTAHRIVYGYDAEDRLTSTSYGDGSPAVGRSYTDDGLPWQISSGGTTWTLAYNNRRLLTAETLSVGGSNYVFSHGINAYGHRASLTYPGNVTLGYAPNALGEATQVSGHAIGVNYHPNGMVAGYTLGNGLGFGATQNVRGLPLQWHHGGVSKDHHAYDANGNVTAITDQQEGGLTSRSMSYDALDRLTGANGIWGSGSFGYDALDNLRSSTVGARAITHHIDAANRLSALSGSVNVALGYDANGNVAQRGAQTYGFDIGNRLHTATGKASYVYDGHGRRAWVAFVGGATKLQIYSQDGLLLYSVHSTQGATRHIYLGRKLIAEVNAQTGAVSYSHTDALGSPIARTNGSGAVTSRTRYEPYGATAAGTNPNGIGFTGHVNDPDTGLVYMQQRYYDPVAGRFLSVDPVVTDSATGVMFNRYEYAKNNPYRYIDPDGRCAASRIDVAPGSICGGSGSALRAAAARVAMAREQIVREATSAARGAGAALAAGAQQAAAMIRFTPLVLAADRMLSEGANKEAGKGASQQSGLGEKKPDDAPSGTIGLDQAGRKFGWDKDTTHGIKDAATGGMAGGRTWVGVAPDGTVGISEGGKWSPQGHYIDLKP